MGQLHNKVYLSYNPDNISTISLVQRRCKFLWITKDTNNKLISKHKVTIKFDNNYNMYNEYGSKIYLIDCYNHIVNKDGDMLDEKTIEDIKNRKEQIKKITDKIEDEVFLKYSVDEKKFIKINPYYFVNDICTKYKIIFDNTNEQKTIFVIR